MAFVEDLSLYFADFGSTVTVDGASVSAIFDEPGDTAPLGVAGASTVAPQLTLPTASVPTEVYHAAVVVPGKGNFRVVEHRPDGTGVSVLQLERAA